jgi:hypothetical protein
MPNIWKPACRATVYAVTRSTSRPQVFRTLLEAHLFHLFLQSGEPNFRLVSSQRAKMRSFHVVVSFVGNFVSSYGSFFFFFGLASLHMDTAVFC